MIQKGLNLGSIVPPQSSGTPTSFDCDTHHSTSWAGFAPNAKNLNPKSESFLGEIYAR
jgi:hypothetical protein